eukprot:CAMPEP_0118640742 /NCGR_PEP_ID=MMETSP0785-20121206/4913_1 /TAXON_ID=91992 /ORGANISM="Bolidomonas pacifica, Strain CCMP 1866" /LENGTH=312 /DNA_ID=CAMNT_0006532145 /DNA_START=192 /DNA_END=1127 /DNA_ORIENTATION=-
MDNDYISLPPSSSDSTPPTSFPTMLIDDTIDDDFTLGLDDNLVSTLFEYDAQQQEQEQQQQEQQQQQQQMDGIGLTTTKTTNSTTNTHLPPSSLPLPLFPPSILSTPTISHAVASKVMPPLESPSASSTAPPSGTVGSTIQIAEEINYEKLFDSGRNSSKSYKSRKNSNTLSHRRNISNDSMISPPPTHLQSSLSLFNESERTLLSSLYNDSDDESPSSSSHLPSTSNSFLHVRPHQLPLDLPEWDPTSNPNPNPLTPSVRSFSPSFLPSSTSFSTNIPSLSLGNNQYGTYPETGTAEYQRGNTFFPSEGIS